MPPTENENRFVALASRTRTCPRPRTSMVARWEVDRLHLYPTIAESHRDHPPGDLDHQRRWRPSLPLDRP